MRFFSTLDDYIEIGHAFLPKNKKSLSDTKRDEKTINKDSDEAAKMEMLIEHETNDLIKKKLEWRLNSGIYEWADLY